MDVAPQVPLVERLKSHDCKTVNLHELGAALSSISSSK